MLKPSFWILIAILIAPVSASAQEPKLDDLETAKLQILQLQSAYAQVLAESEACRQQLAPLRASAISKDLSSAEVALRSFVDQRHPGFSWDPRTGVFTPRDPNDPRPANAIPYTEPVSESRK